MPQRICNRRIIIAKVDAGPCDLPTENPQRPMCTWHRLDRTTFGGQAQAAAMRLAAAPEPHRLRVPAAQWPPGFRWCAGCQAFVPIWYCSGTTCKACARAARAATRASTVYGIEPLAWKAILALQGGRCAICRNRQRDRAPSIDHDHATGEVRGGLCTRCNHELLGGAHDSPRRLAAGLVYLLAPPASGRWQAPELVLDTVLAAVMAALEAPGPPSPVRRPGPPEE